MLQRAVIERLDISQFESDKYAIIGFNSLTKAEEDKTNYFKKERNKYEQGC